MHVCTIRAREFDERHQLPVVFSFLSFEFRLHIWLITRVQPAQITVYIAAVIRSHFVSSLAVVCKLTQSGGGVPCHST